MSEFNDFQIGEKVTLVKISDEIVDRNRHLKIGDTGTIVKFLAEYYQGHPQVTISWDREGIGDTRRIDGILYPNCWAISIHGIENKSREGYTPLLWKIKTMFERQPYMQKQQGV